MMERTWIIPWKEKVSSKVTGHHPATLLEKINSPSQEIFKNLIQISEYLLYNICSMATSGRNISEILITLKKPKKTGAHLRKRVK